jgi:hypothetical protein
MILSFVVLTLPRLYSLHGREASVNTTVALSFLSVSLVISTVHVSRTFSIKDWIPLSFSEQGSVFPVH